MASKQGHGNVVNRLLKDKRACLWHVRRKPVDPTDEGNSAIVYASLYGRIDILNILLKDGRAVLRSWSPSLRVCQKE